MQSLQKWSSPGLCAAAKKVADLETIFIFNQRKSQINEFVLLSRR
jgi:hypothetical protein